MSDKRCDYCGKFFRGKEKTGFVAGLSNNHGPPSNDKIISCSAGLTWPDGQALEPNQINAHNGCCAFMRGVNQIGSQQRGRHSEGLDERPPVLPPKKLAVKSAKEKALDLRAEGELFRSQAGQIKSEEKPAAGGSAEAPEEAPERAAADEPMEVEEGANAMARGEPMLVVKGRRKGAIDPNRRLDSYLSQPKVLLRLARVRARERNDAIAALERKSEQHANARGGYPVTKLFTCHTSSTTNIPLCAEKLGESGMHMHAPQTHPRHEKSTCTWCHFFSIKMAHVPHPACTVATAGSLLAWPCDASWRLQRLHGSTCLAAASQAAIAAVPRPWPPRTLHLLLLGGCFRRPSERPERARARSPPATQAAKPPPPPPPTLRPSSLLLLPPFQPPSQPHRPLEPPHDACTQRTRKGQKRCTNGRRAGQNGGNERRRVVRAGMAVVAAAGPGKAACRHAAAAAGRVQGFARAENWPAYRDRGGRLKRRLRCHCCSHRRLIRRCRRRTRCLQPPRCSRRLSSRPSCHNGCPSRVRRPAQRAHS